MNNQRGQSNVETAVMILAIITVVVAFVGIVYLTFSSYWVQHIMYEALICNQERNQISFCEREAKQRFQSIMLLKDFHFQLQSREDFSRAKLQMKFHSPLLKEQTFSFIKDLRI